MEESGKSGIFNRYFNEEFSENSEKSANTLFLASLDQIDEKEVRISAYDLHPNGRIFEFSIVFKFFFQKDLVVLELCIIEMLLLLF